MSKSIRVMVSGPYAIYCRPECKVERVSYDVPTISALEGMLKSIYWKPAFRIVIDRVIVFNPIKFINVRRNEVKTKIPLGAVKSQMRGGEPYEFYAAEQRTQRAAMLLRDVKYGVEFHIELTGLRSEHEDECEEKHYSIMVRRLKKGQCFRQPCLGCREFAATVEYVEEFDMSQVSPELKGDKDLGYMLYGMKFADGGVPVNGSWDEPKFSDNADPMYYRPHMIDGVIDVAKYKEGIVC